MRLISWNIQYGTSADGAYVLDRQIGYIAAGGYDVVCLQEVADGFPDLDVGRGTCQSSIIEQRLPDYHASFGAAVEGRLGARSCRFGNMILSRQPPLRIDRYRLPAPAAPGVEHMPRQAIEIEIACGTRRLRILTTHLEFGSAAQNTAQAHGLWAWQEQIAAEAAMPPPLGAGPYAFGPKAADALLCGDLNSLPGTTAHAVLTAQGRFRDSWRLVRGDQPHLPTCGVHDRKNWPTPDTRDYFLVTPSLAGSVRETDCDTTTMLSDHQPITITLDI